LALNENIEEQVQASVDGGETSVEINVSRTKIEL
jgi:hypothetical protein